MASSSPQLSLAELAEAIRRIHAQLRQRLIEQGAAAGHEARVGVPQAAAGDVVYGIDQALEAELVELFAAEVAARDPIVLIGEGIPAGQITLPVGTAESDAAWRIIVDPLDGTRGWMYQKRSGWILTGVAPNRGPATSLADVVVAVQTEAPLEKQFLADELWAIAGQGWGAARWNRLTGERMPLDLRPSTATDLAHGFATVCRFFAGGRDRLGAFDEALFLKALGPRRSGEALAFEDQYASTAGQLYGLVAGQDRLVVDVRPWLAAAQAARGEPPGICCHPYDLCTKLIAEEAGVLVRDPAGDGKVHARLGVDVDVAWAGYANDAIRCTVEPILPKLRSLLGGF